MKFPATIIRNFLSVCIIAGSFVCFLRPFGFKNRSFDKDYKRNAFLSDDLCVESSELERKCEIKECLGSFAYSVEMQMRANIVQCSMVILCPCDAT